MVTSYILFPPFSQQKAKATTPQCFRSAATAYFDSNLQANKLIHFAVFNIAQLLSDCKGFLLRRIAKRAAKIFTCRFRASAHEKRLPANAKSRGHAPRFFTLKERKVSAQELFSVRVLRSQNTYCRQSVSFATVFRSPTARVLWSRPPARRRRAPRRRPACPRADRSR